MRKPPVASGGPISSGRNIDDAVLAQRFAPPQESPSSVPREALPHPLASQVPLTPQAVAIRVGQTLAFLDELRGFDGDRDEIAEAFYRLEDECWCIANIHKMPPVEQRIELLSAGWRCVFPLIANGDCSPSYALHRTDEIVRAAKLNLTRRECDRAVELICLGPPI
jgi:hypothetical protein